MGTVVVAVDIAVEEGMVVVAVAHRAVVVVVEEDTME